ncbi:hypothetical protein EZS27_008037 [termite gut metagenome]|uniref:Uncharacterized protein n=1 Tax=termite gut metagenome TaxID=433724 RepID=A0A5J4SGG8_9ZZZZ
MDVNRAKYSYVIIHICVTLLTALGGFYVLHSLIPEHYFSGYPFIAIYFFVLGVVHFFLFDLYDKYTQRKKLLFYMAIKVQKFILSIVVLVVYCLLVRTFIMEFVFTFVAFYLITLLFETIFFYHLEWKSKKNRTQ